MYFDFTSCGRFSFHSRLAPGKGMKEQPFNYVEVYNNLLLKNDDSVNGIKCLDCTWMKSWGFFLQKE